MLGISPRPSALSKESTARVLGLTLPGKREADLVLAFTHSLSIIGAFVIIGLKQRSPLMVPFNPFIKASGMLQTQKKASSNILGITCHSLFTHP
jgi:hypothetical protein